MNYQNPFSRWPRHDGYREVERIADVALMPADEVPRTTVEWLWPNTIPIGHLTLVAGEPTSGKSFWMADLAARVSFFRPWPYSSHYAPRDVGQQRSHYAPRDVGLGADGSPHAEREGYGTPPKSPIQSQNGSVIIVNSDDGFTDVQQPRLAAAVANMPNIGLMRRLPPGSRFSQMHSVGPVTDRLQALKSAVKEAGDCRLVIVDDLARFVRTGTGKVTRADLLLALDSLKAIAGECNVAMVVVWRLERTGRATAKYLETFLPAAAVAWLVGSDPYRDGLRWTVPLKNHFGPLGEPMAFSIEQNSVVWLRPPEVVPSDVMAAFLRKSDRRLERELAGKWALERLAEGPVEARVLFDDAAAFGFRERTLRRALGELGLKPTKCGNDGPWLWWLERVQGSGFRVQEGSDGEFQQEEIANCESQIANCKSAPDEGQNGDERAAKTQDQSPKSSELIQDPTSKIANPEDCQLAPNREQVKGDREQVPETSPTETAEPSIQNPTSKPQNFEDGQFATNREQVTGQGTGGGQIADRNGGALNPKSKIENPKFRNHDRRLAPQCARRGGVGRRCHAPGAAAVRKSEGEERGTDGETQGPRPETKDQRPKTSILNPKSFEVRNAQDALGRARLHFEEAGLKLFESSAISATAEYLS